MTLRVSHHRGIDEAQVEIPIPRIYLRCTLDQSLSHEIEIVFTSRHRGQESCTRIAVHSRPQQLIHFNDHRIQNDELAPKLSNESRRQIVRSVPSICCGNDGSGIAQHPQSLETSSRRYVSALRPRSSGPSPEAT